MSAGDELIALSHEKWDRMSAKDIGWLDGLFHAEAIFVHMGATFTKREELEVIEIGRIHYREALIEDTSVRIIDATGIVLTTLVMNSVVDGKEVSNPFAVTEIYIHDEDASHAWKLAAMSFTRLVNH